MAAPVRRERCHRVVRGRTVTPLLFVYVSIALAIVLAVVDLLAVSGILTAMNPRYRWWRSALSPSQPATWQCSASVPDIQPLSELRVVLLDHPLSLAVGW